MKMKTNLLFVLLAALFTFACSDDDDNTQEPDNEEEEITSVVISLTEGGNTNTFRFRLDDTGTPIVDETIQIAANTTYSSSVTFLNEEEIPAEDVTIEVLAEAAEHLVCYTPSVGTNLSITNTDQDSNGLEVGLTSTWVTGDAATGTVTVTLKHQPDLKAAPVNCSIGETDIEVAFDLEIS